MNQTRALRTPPARPVAKLVAVGFIAPNSRRVQVL